MRVRSLSQEDPLEEGVATHSSILAWRRVWQPTLVFLPGDSPGQRSLVGDSPWGPKELTMPEVPEHTHERSVFMSVLISQLILLSSPAVSICLSSVYKLPFFNDPPEFSRT